MSWGTWLSWLSRASLKALPAGAVTSFVVQATPFAVMITSASMGAALGGGAPDGCPEAGGPPEPDAPGPSAATLPDPMGRIPDARTEATTTMATMPMNVGSGQRGAGPLSMWPVRSAS